MFLGIPMPMAKHYFLKKKFFFKITFHHHRADPKFTPLLMSGPFLEPLWRLKLIPAIKWNSYIRTITKDDDELHFLSSNSSDL